MILVKPSATILEIMGGIHHGTAIDLIEIAGRTCYKSEDKIDDDSAKGFIKGIMKRGHESVIEHSAATVRIICDRGVTHEIVRHRLVAYSQESTRYCNYKGGVTFVIPPWVDKITPGEYEHLLVMFDAQSLWHDAMLTSERDYQALIEKFSWSPQQARSVLPNSLKTEIVCTANFREWRHIFKLRTSKAAHPQMREIMVPLLAEFKERVPVIFDDIEVS